MFASFNRSWEVLKQSYAVLQKQKTLAVLPILSGFACLAVMASFIAPIFIFPDQFKQLAEAAQDADDPNQLWIRVGGFAAAFLFYFVNYFIIVFFNTALASCAIVHFKGGEPTLGDGLAAAGRRLPQIVAWALLAATVGMILKAIEDRAEKVGQIVSGLLGLVWSAAVYLVVPILAVEGLGPIAAIKRSVGLLRKTWGESLAGGLSLGLAGFLLMLPGIGLIILGAYLGQQSQVALAGLIGLGVVYLVVASIILSTLKQIFIAGLYLYAAEGQLPDGFSQRSVADAFPAK